MDNTPSEKIMELSATTSKRCIRENEKKADGKIPQKTATRKRKSCETVTSGEDKENENAYENNITECGSKSAESPDLSTAGESSTNNCLSKKKVKQYVPLKIISDEIHFKDTYQNRVFDYEVLDGNEEWRRDYMESDTVNNVDNESRKDYMDYDIDAVNKNANKELKNKNNKKKNVQCQWTEEETKFFINLCISKRVLKLMDGKKLKHADIYSSLEKDMKENGFIKTGSQMKTKMKNLKEMYYKCKRNNCISGHDRMTFAFFDLMDELLGTRPTAMAISGIGVESIFNMREVDICDEPTEIPPATEGENQMEKKIISGRISNVKKLEKCGEVFGKMVQEQQSLFDASIKMQFEEQKKWEMEMMKQEHEHQSNQMQMIMSCFLKGLETLKQPSQPMQNVRNPNIDFNLENTSTLSNLPLINVPNTSGPYTLMDEAWKRPDIKAKNYHQL